MTAAEYRRLVQEGRKAQLAHDADTVQGISDLLARVASRLRQEIMATPRGIGGERYKRELLASVEAELSRFRSEYKTLLDGAILEAARRAEEAEKRLFDAATASLNPQGQAAFEFPEGGNTSRQIAPGRAADVTFGQVPRQALERAYLRTHRDGLRLSERLYNLNTVAKKAATDIVLEGIATGQSAAKMARRLELLLTGKATDADVIAERERVRAEARKAAKEARAKGQEVPPVPNIENIRYRAMRIARTETNLAHREGKLAAATKPDGTLQDHIRAIGWRLSPSHPRIDICDHWAGVDDGLGRGNYLPENVPVGHPNCLCHLVTLLHALPNEEFVQKKAHPEQVKPGEIAYYEGVSKTNTRDDLMQGYSKVWKQVNRTPKQQERLERFFEKKAAENPEELQEYLRKDLREAARLLGVPRSKVDEIVNEIRIYEEIKSIGGNADAGFGIENDEKKTRFIAVKPDFLYRPYPARLIRMLHELQHAIQFENTIQFFGGDIEKAYLFQDNVKRKGGYWSFWYNRQEYDAESTAFAAVLKRFGLSVLEQADLVEASRTYVRQYQRMGRHTIPSDYVRLIERNFGDGIESLFPLPPLD